MKSLLRKLIVLGLAFGAGGLALLVLLISAGPELLCERQKLCTYIPRHEAPEQVHLSWSSDPISSVTVSWATGSQDNESLVEYREVGTEDWRQTKGSGQPTPRNRIWPNSGALHRAVLKGLRPDTAYEYRVSGDVGGQIPWSKTYQTRTAPLAGGSTYQFAFITDTCLVGRVDGMASGTAQIIEEITKDSPLLVLGGGDYACANRDGRYHTASEAADAWFRQMQPLLSRSPLMAQYGNHEIHLKERFSDWAPRFAHPEGFGGGQSYSFDIGNAHFTSFFVPLRRPSDESIAWLEADLADARRRGMKWLIVYQHQPLYSHGKAHPIRPEVVEALEPVFAKHGVDLHLSGQDRNFERTFPLAGGTGAPVAASRSLDTYEAGTGVIYAKVGPSGSMSEQGYDFSKFTVEKPDFVAAWSDDAHHYALVTVSEDRLQVQIYTLVGDGTPKRIRDEFSILAASSSG